MSEVRYQLTVSEAQLGMISTACEIAARACIGQFDGIAFKLFMGQVPTGQFCQIRDALQAVQPLVTGDEHLSAAITDDLRDDHELAWSLYHAARYRLYVDRCEAEGKPMDGWTVLSYPPCRHGRHDAPEIVRLEAQP